MTFTLTSTPFCLSFANISEVLSFAALKHYEVVRCPKASRTHPSVLAACLPHRIDANGYLVNQHGLPVGLYKQTDIDWSKYDHLKLDHPATTLYDKENPPWTNARMFSEYSAQLDDFRYPSA